MVDNRIPTVFTWLGLMFAKEHSRARPGVSTIAGYWNIWKNSKSCDVFSKLLQIFYKQVHWGDSNTRNDQTLFFNVGPPKEDIFFWPPSIFYISINNPHIFLQITFLLWASEGSARAQTLNGWNTLSILVLFSNHQLNMYLHFLSSIWMFNTKWRPFYISIAYQTT